MPAIAKRITSILMALCLMAVAVVAYLQLTKKDDEYQVTAYFEKGIGLFPNSDVTILGVAVGKIHSVEPVGDRVRVEMNINSDYKIPADATAEIVPISIISDRYIEFAPVYQSGPTLQDGATLDVASTKIPAELDDVFKQLKKLLDALAPQQEGELGSLGEMIVALDKALSGREEDLKGTIVNGAQLTRTLARARGDISNLLVNLDELFSKLAPHAGDFATLNKNFAIVMQYLADSRQDIEGTLEGLSEMTGEVGDFVRDNKVQLATLLEKAAKITPVVLKNKDSVIQSLEWLPVVGEGLRNAYHGGDINATDVRSDRPNAGLCEDFDDLFPIEDPPPELEDIFEQILDALEDEFCPSPDPEGGGGPAVPASPPAPEAPTAPPSPEDIVPSLKLECSKAVKTIKKQIDRIEEIGISDELKSGIVDPLKKRIKKVRRNCEDLGGAIEDPGSLEESLEDVLDDLPDNVREVLPDAGEGGVPGVGDLTGNAAGGSPVGGTPSPSIGSQIGSWFGGFMDFVGLS
jgi:virulence factor Mce-like protein